MKSVNQIFESQFFLGNNMHIWINRFTENFSVPYHEHDFIEYCYVAEGTGFHHIGQETIPIHKGQLFVIPIGVAHVFRPSTPDPSSQPPVIYNCLFDIHLADKLSILQDHPIQEHVSSLRGNTSSYFYVIDQDGSIESIMLNLHREISINTTCSKTMLYALLNQLIVTVYRRNLNHSVISASHTDDFAHVIHFLEQHIHQKITLKDISRFSGWTPRHLQRLFLKHTGQSFGSLLQRLRIQKSCEILRNTSFKVGLISELVGYRSVDSFNTAFKKIVGLSPSEYRKFSS